jgi:glycosyltransferase involved in cell wall biosynthesis
MSNTLRGCIQSCINQQYRHIEILVIDDGSTDETSTLASKLIESDDRIKYVYQENQGQSAAMNTGLAESSGEYVFFLDADDYIYDYCISTLLDNLEKTDADISIGSALWATLMPNRRKNEIKTYTSTEALELLTEIHSWNFIKRAFETSWNKLIRKSLFERFNYPVGSGRDGLFCAHHLLAKAKLIVGTPLETYYYSYEPKQRPYLSDLFAAYEDRLQFFKELGQTELVSKVCLEYALIYCRKYRHDEAILEKARNVFETYKEFLDEHDCAFLENILH